jgi:lipopolysaccharide export system protein LptA
MNLSRHSHAGRALAGAIALALALTLAPSALQAQSMSEKLAGLKAKSDQPIDIEADKLEVLDGEKQAIFSGNVMAKQGGMTLRTKELSVSYSGNQGLSGSSTNITRIKATGKVLITTDNNQTATSDWADFKVVEQVMTIGGNVVLSQGENVIKGDRLVIDLKTGRSRFENEGQLTANKRVRGIFKPKQLGDAVNKGAAAVQGEAGTETPQPAEDPSAPSPVQ